MEEALHNLGIELGSLIAQAINFSILLVVLWKFLYTPILKMLSERSKKIEESLKNAEKIEKTLANTESEKEEILNEAKKEADAILKAARKAGKDVEKGIVEAAEERAKTIIIKAKEDAQKAKADSLEELKNDVGLLVEKSLAAILEQKGEKYDDQLINEALAKVE